MHAKQTRKNSTRRSANCLNDYTLKITRRPKLKENQMSFHSYQTTAFHLMKRGEEQTNRRLRLDKK